MVEEREPLNEGMRQAAERVNRMVNGLTAVILLLLFVVGLRFWMPDLFTPAPEAPVVAQVAPSAPEVEEGIVNGIHVETGLVVDANWELVRATCTACHSAKLVTQNRADREGWTEMIRWMQKTQNLWDLGENEPLILDYLATHYAPQKKGRRARLTNIEWYELEP